MARKRLGGKPSNKKEIALKFKSRPKSNSRLFGKELNSTLSKGEQDYFIVVDALQGNKVEPTLKQVGAFFAQQYRFIFNCDCIDYNWFNFQKTALMIKDYLKFSTNVELAQFLAESFIRYEKVRKKLNLNEKLPTVSTFKRAFILEELSGNIQPKFDGFY